MATKPKANVTFQLYDLKNDPGERQDRALDFPNKVKELKQILDQVIAGGRTRPMR